MEEDEILVCRLLRVKEEDKILLGAKDFVLLVDVDEELFLLSDAGTYD